jgi:hypothetical protein
MQRFSFFVYACCSKKESLGAEDGALALPKLLASRGVLLNEV